MSIRHACNVRNAGRASDAGNTRSAGPASDAGNTRSAGPASRVRHACHALGLSAIALLWNIDAARAADLLITNARIFTGTSADVIDNGSVAITNGRIEAVFRTAPNARGAGAVDAGTSDTRGAGAIDAATSDTRAAGAADARGAKVIDARGRTVMPGLINGHFHLFFDFHEQRYFPTSDAEARKYLQGPLRERLAAHLEHGFTSILSPIDLWPYIADARDQVAKGTLQGPRLFIAGGVLMSPGGHYVCRMVQGEARRWCDEHISFPIDSVEKAREGVRHYAQRQVDFIMYDGSTNSTHPPQIVAAMVDEAHKRGLRVLVHNARAADVNALLAAGVDGFVHPPSGPWQGAPVQLPGGRRLPLALTMGGSEEAIRAGRASEEVRKNYQLTRDNVMALLKAGAVPIFASDLPGFPPQQIAPMVSRTLSGVGLSNAQVLQAATRDAAQVLLAKADLGTLEPGKLADLIIVDGDPVLDLAALTKVQIVVKDGKVVVDKTARAAQSR